MNSRSRQALRVGKWTCFALFLGFFVLLPATSLDPRVAWVPVVAVLPLVWPDLVTASHWIAGRASRRS